VTEEKLEKAANASSNASSMRSRRDYPVITAANVVISESYQELGYDLDAHEGVVGARLHVSFILSSGNVGSTTRSAAWCQKRTGSGACRAGKYRSLH
jgi:hypothetical protein